MSRLKAYRTESIVLHTKQIIRSQFGCLSAPLETVLGIEAVEIMPPPDNVDLLLEPCIVWDAEYGVAGTATLAVIENKISLWQFFKFPYHPNSTERRACTNYTAAVWRAIRQIYQFELQDAVVQINELQPYTIHAHALGYRADNEVKPASTKFWEAFLDTLTDEEGDLLEDLATPSTA